MNGRATENDHVFEQVQTILSPERLSPVDVRRRAEQMTVNRLLGAFSLACAKIRIGSLRQQTLAVEAAAVGKPYRRLAVEA